jgi:hypothetical protein
MAPLSSVTLSGTHFRRYGACTGGVADNIPCIDPTFFTRKRFVARASSCHVKLTVSTNLACLMQPHPVVLYRDSVNTPLVLNSQKRCQVFCHFSKDLKFDVPFSSLRDL